MINRIIQEEILRINEFLTQDGVSLLQYFSQTDEQKKESLPYMFDWGYLFQQFAEENDIDIGYDLDNEFDGVDTLEPDLVKQYADWLFEKIDDGTLNVEPNEYPAWTYLDSPVLIKNQWLIHFTNNPNSIADEGFKYGVDDIDKLGLTTYEGDFAKKYGGYNFAYTLNDFSKYAKSNQGWRNEYKYGNYAVVFNASGVKLWHYSDEEYQVIFYGNTARNIIPITQGENEKYGIYSNKTSQLLFESDELEKVVSWLVKNFVQYRKHLI